MWEFNEGQLVVCIDDKFDDRVYKEKLPTLYNIYTIREITDWPDGLLAFHLVEIVNEKRHYFDIGPEEIWFYARRFRPVKPTNIDLFKELLIKTPVLADDILEKQDEYVL